MPKPVMYLASPYTHGRQAVVELRYCAVLEESARLLNTGKLVYSPIAHCHELAILHGLPADIDFWREYNFAMIELLPRFGILTLQGYDTSVGVEDERTFAATLGRDIELVKPVGDYAIALARWAVR